MPVIISKVIKTSTILSPPFVISHTLGWVVLTQFWVKYGQTQPLGYIFKLHFLTQLLGLSIFYPKLGSNNPAFFRVQVLI